MEVLLACLQLAAYVALGLALPLPRLRRPAQVLLLLAAATGVALGVTGPAERTLTTVHTYAGFEPAAFEVSMVAFPTGAVTAPGWQWPLPFAGFALLWCAVLQTLGTRPPRSPLVVAMCFAWSATAAWLGMQALAAPSALVQPVGIDRFLYPAGLALAIGAARQASGLLPLFVTLSAGTIGARLPAALFSKYASDHRLGTSLDVTDVIDIVNPMTQMQFDPRLAPGSGAQQFWLIWLEHVLVFPTLYLLSLAGVAFGVHMFHRHGPSTEPTRAE
ncbi:MAG: hypothetical protein JNL08_13910 [Planctomycetes bacterium]|nr:hypothetical protein [Planctomycetota bacterium]